MLPILAGEVAFEGKGFEDMIARTDVPAVQNYNKLCLIKIRFGV